MTFKAPEEYRLDEDGCMALGMPAGYGTSEVFGNYGAFLLPAVVPGRPLKVIASEGQGWDHVSVSIQSVKLKTPTWLEMCAVKEAFWGSEDEVMQLHPRASEYVNYHAACLHLWRPNDGRKIPEPPSILVGPDSSKKTLGADVGAV